MKRKPMAKTRGRDRMKKILILQSGAYFGQHTFTKEERQHIFEEIDMYELKNTDFNRYKCMSIDGFADQQYLMKHRQVFEDFLATGKIIIFSGNIFLPWLPGVSKFTPKTIKTHRDYEVENKQNHAIFSGVMSTDMTYRKGVAGFFARGHHPVPDGAEVILTLRDGLPITYIDRVSSSGTIVVHAGNDLFTYNNPKCTTGRIKSQLVEWINAEYRALQEGNQ